MAFNERLTLRVRKALAHLQHVEEKKMFRGITFMVNGKMCISVSDDHIMVRFDPLMHEEILKTHDCRTVEMGGRKYKGYVYVNEQSLSSEKEFDYWIKLALDFNKKAKAAKKKT